MKKKLEIDLCDIASARDDLPLWMYPKTCDGRYANFETENWWRWNVMVFSGMGILLTHGMTRF